MRPWYQRFNLLIALLLAVAGFVLSYFIPNESAARVAVGLAGVGLGILYLLRTSRIHRPNERD